MKITEKQDEKNWISRHKWLSYQLWFSHLILNYKSTFTLIKLLMHSLVAQTVKNPPALQETWVQSLGWEDPLEEEMATHSSIRAWRIPMYR